MRNYEAPPRLEGESNQEWCDRYAASIPADELLAEMILSMHRLRKRRGPAWSQVGQLCGHGSGVSSAIVRRFLGDSCPEEAIR